MKFRSIHCKIVLNRKGDLLMFYLKKTEATGRYEINIFGLKMKFRLKGSNDKGYEKLDNLLYELADPRTLASVKLPKVLKASDALYSLVSSNKSMARLGDGEFKLIMGENISFQKYDPILAERLKKILRNQNDMIWLGITDCFGYCSSAYLRRVMVSCRNTLYKFIDFSKTYIDTNVTRQLEFVNEQQGKDYYNAMKTIWQSKDIVLVEGAGSRLGIGNDLFTNASSVQRILCPIKDAFSKYDEILKECLKQPKNKLFLLALGPTATVLAEDLTNAGYRALDIGHLDTAYEAFLRKKTKFVHIEGKIVFNEERNKNYIKPCSDKKYYEQIISTIE